MISIQQKRILDLRQNLWQLSFRNILMTLSATTAKLLTNFFGKIDPKISSSRNKSTSLHLTDEIVTEEQDGWPLVMNKRVSQAVSNLWKN